MKVYTRVVMDFDGNVLEEESYEYEGPVAQCGGSSGGGGSSGSVDYPSYMKHRHEGYLDVMSQFAVYTPNPFVDVNAPSITRLTGNTSIEELETYLQQRINEVHGLAFEPSIELCLQQPMFYNQIMQLICLTLDYLESNHNVTIPSDIATQIAYLDARITQIANITDLEDSLDVETVVYPRFLAGMRDINAIQMSSFIVGKAVLEGVYQAKTVELRENLSNEAWKMRTEMAQVAGNIHLEASKTDAARIQNLLQVVAALVSTGGSVAGNVDTLKANLETTLKTLHVELIKIRESSLSHLDGLVDAHAAKSIELSRMQVVAMFEQSNVNIDYDEKQYRWELENWQYVANMLAAIGSGTASAGGRQTSKFSSALGGALSGAAAGATVGGAPGAAVGGLIGLGASLLS